MPILSRTASSPEIQTRASSFRFSASVRSSPLSVFRLAVGLAPVAVMGLVVDDDDVPLAAKLPANTVDHLGGGLVEVGAKNLLGQLVGLDQLADLEHVEVGE